MVLKGKTCIVTGAGRGIGKGIGLRLASEGGHVVFADIDLQQAEAAAAEARALGGEAVGMDVDVTRREQIRALIASTISNYGRLERHFQQRRHQ